MITSSKEYMERLNDIQNQNGLKQLVMLPGDEARFIIDANKRTIIVPDEFTFLGVKNDHKAETVYFEIDRYFDQVDLSTKTCIVQFESVNIENNIEQVIGSGFYPVVKMDVDTADGKIIFGQEIQNDVTAYAATVYFSIRFYETKSENDNIVFTYNFNTLAASLPVKDSLATMNNSVNIRPGEIESLTNKFSEYLKAAQDAANKIGNGLTDNEKHLLLTILKDSVKTDTAIMSYNTLAKLWGGETLPDTDGKVASLGICRLGKMILGRS